ncbi:MAG: hypothetical protein OXE52_20390 [Chloroflexi bacterium]|nr:hypothetical protein [Chloroflexota bacterium]
MTWTTPKTDWATGELITANDMNAVGENLTVLKSPAMAVYTTTEDINALTNSEFVDVDSINLNLAITTAGGNVLAHFDGVMVRGSRDTESCLDIAVNGVRIGGNQGLMRVKVEDEYISQSFTRVIQNLGAGNHTFRLQWKNPNHVLLYAGAQFSVREI